MGVRTVLPRSGPFEDASAVVNTDPADNVPAPFENGKSSSEVT